MKVKIKVALLDCMAKIPYKKRKSDLCYDIYCVRDYDFIYSFKKENNIYTLKPWSSHTFRTGIVVATPPEYGFLLRDRSSLGIKDIAVRAGVIEGTYRGEWLIHLQNLSNKEIVIQEGDRIAQAKLVKIIPAEIEQCDEYNLPSSDRGTDGWGSSGK